MGVKSRKWLDGRHVALDEWEVGEPNGAENDCSRMRADGGMHKLFDKDCLNTYFSLCKRSS